MWSKKHKLPDSCSECNAPLPAQAEACSECGYPVTLSKDEYAADEGKHASELEYKLVQLLGAVVFVVGVVAGVAESPIAASVALTIGGATYLSGLMGAWWNRGD